MGNVTEGKGGTVPDSLYPVERPLSLRECLRPVPSAKLGPLHGPGLPSKHLPDGTHEVLKGKEAVAGEAANEADMGGQTFRGPTGGCTKIATASGEKKHVDIGGDVEACQRESLRASGPMERAGTKEMTRESS